MATVLALDSLDKCSWHNYLLRNFYIPFHNVIINTGNFLALIILKMKNIGVIVIRQFTVAVAIGYFITFLKQH